MSPMSISPAGTAPAASSAPAAGPSRTHVTIGSRSGR